MSLQAVGTAPPSPIRHGWLRSTAAVFAGIVSIFALSIVGDFFFHSLTHTPNDQPMYDNGLLAIALGYRAVFGVLASIVVAWLAPSHKVGHALVFGGIGVAIGTIGAISMWSYAVPWYNIGVILVALPAAWVGARLFLNLNR
jgi:hypothetical protein